ncbi:MAG: hypothetical protein WDM79_16625 [Terricaulis sp.]
MTLSGARLAGPGSPLIFGLLGASLAICVALAGILAHRIFRIARASAASQTAARSFTFASSGSSASSAVAPAVIVAAFLGLTF